MAVVFIDGFDKYGMTSDLISTPENEWQGLYTNSANMIVGPALGTTPGYSLCLSMPLGGSAGNPYFADLKTTLPKNYSRLIGGFRFKKTAQLPYHGITFFDGMYSTQCSIRLYNYVFMQPGSIYPASTLSTSGAIVINTTYIVEFDISFHPFGKCLVWLNNTLVINVTINTAPTGNNYCNTVGFTNYVNQNTVINTYYDDFYLFDATGTRNNRPILGDYHIETQFPITAIQSQFIPTGNATYTCGLRLTTQTGGIATTGNNYHLRQIQPSTNGTIANVCIKNTTINSPYNMKAILYTDAGNYPGNKIAMGGNVYIGSVPTGTDYQSLPFDSPQTVTAGTKYWIGLVTSNNAAITVDVVTTAVCYRGSCTYATGPANTISGATLYGYYQIWTYVTATNTNIVNLTYFDGDTSSVTTTTTGDKDMYSFTPLISAPAIATAVVKLNAKSETGTGKLAIHTLSNAVDSKGSNELISTTTAYGYYSTYYDTDPNTGLRWTTTALDAAKTGFSAEE